AQGPDEKCGTFGRTLGITFVMSLSFQIVAPRWGGVSRGADYGTAPPESSSKPLTHLPQRFIRGLVLPLGDETADGRCPRATIAALATATRRPKRRGNTRKCEETGLERNSAEPACPDVPAPARRAMIVFEPLARSARR